MNAGLIGVISGASAGIIIGAAFGIHIYMKYILPLQIEDDAVWAMLVRYRYKAKGK